MKKMKKYKKLEKYDKNYDDNVIKILAFKGSSPKEAIKLAKSTCGKNIKHIVTRELQKDLLYEVVVATA